MFDNQLSSHPKVLRHLVAGVIAPTLLLGSWLSVCQAAQSATIEFVADSQTEVRLGNPTNAVQTNALQNFRTTFNQRRPRGEGIRRGGLCALSPGTDVLQSVYWIWSDRPLFLWRTEANQLALQKLTVLQTKTEEIVWETTLEDLQQRVDYQGKALEPGKTYSWELTFKRQKTQTNRPESLTYRFQVLPADQRKQIASELQAIAQRLKAAKASDEIIAIQQAQYFAQQGLLSDALQTLYAINNPSTETKKTLQELVESACSPKKKS